MPTVQSLRLPGRAPLELGAEVTIRGLGRCRWRGEVTYHPDGTVAWLNVYERRNGGCRSVTPDRVTAVHRTARLRAANGAT